MVVTATEQPTKLKIHGNHRRSSFCCVIGIRSFTSAALQCGDIPVRPVGTPTAIIPVASRVKEESSCKIHYRQSGVSLLGACHRRQGERGEELCRMQSMRTILPWYRNKLAATWLLAPRLKDEDWEGGRAFCARLSSVISELLLVTAISTRFLSGRCKRLGLFCPGCSLVPKSPKGPKSSWLILHVTFWSLTCKAMCLLMLFSKLLGYFFPPWCQFLIMYVVCAFCHHFAYCMKIYALFLMGEGELMHTGFCLFKSTSMLANFYHWRRL